MTSVHDFEAETTGEIRLRRQKVRDQERVDTLTATLAAAEPAQAYTRATIALGAAAVIDWVALAIHAVLVHDTQMSPILGVHLAVFVTITLSAAVFVAGWARWKGNSRDEAKRDEIRAIRHRQLTDLLAASAQATSVRELKAFVYGCQQEPAPTGSTDARGRPADSGGVVPLRARSGPFGRTSPMGRSGR